MIAEWPEDEESLHRTLNKEFYASYNSGYFINKALILGAILAKPEQLLDIVKTGYEIGKIKVSGVDDSSITLQAIEEYAKQELVINHYHATETLFRLLFAAVEYPQCPWIGLTEISNFSEFKKRVAHVSDGTYFISDKDEALASVLFGGRKTFETMSNDDWLKNMQFVNELIGFLAHELINTPDYNAFKHGQALFNTKFGFSIGEELKADSQDTFIYLYRKVEKSKGRETHKLIRNLKFMKWETRYALTYLIHRLTDNIIFVSAVRLGIEREARLSSFHTLVFSEIIGNGIHFSEMGQQLREVTYKRSPKSRKKR